jgi:hypothetical protein
LDQVILPPSLMWTFGTPTSLPALTRRSGPSSC